MAEAIASQPDGKPELGPEGIALRPTAPGGPLGAAAAGTEAANVVGPAAGLITEAAGLARGAAGGEAAITAAGADGAADRGAVTDSVSAGDTSELAPVGAGT